MIFEQQLVDVSEVHENLRLAVEKFNQNQMWEAYLEARKVFRGPAESKAELRALDWLFMSDLASAVGLFDVSRIFDFHGNRSCPGDEFLSLLCAWDQSAKLKFFECQKDLESLKSKLSDRFQPTLAAIDAYNYSIVGWRRSAEEALSRVREMEFDDAMTWYVLSRAYSYQSEWNDAVFAGEKAVEKSPFWTRARCSLNDSLLAIGDVEGAQQLINFEEPKQSCSLDFARAINAEAIGDVELCKEQLRQVVERWPVKNRQVRFAARHLSLLLLRDNEIEKAKVVIKKYRLRKLESLELNEGTQALISVPRISQNFNHCVPTVASMVASSQGVDKSPLELAKAMNTRHGTPLFRMVDYMKSLGFRAECIKVDPDTIISMLDQGVPLIGNLTGLYSSHVDVVCGYHSGLKLIHMRDPMHWFGYSLPYEDLGNHYRESGGLWALIAPDRVDNVHIAADHLDAVGQAYLDLHRACAQGNRLEAERAYAEIPDDHELATMRDGSSTAMVITPRQFQESAEKLIDELEDKKVTVSSLRVMMSQIYEENADKIYEIAESKKKELGEKFIEFVHVHCLMAKSKWAESEEILTKLANEAPGNEQAWSLLSTIQIQLGKHDEARTSLDRAIDISPENDSLQNKAIELDGNDLSFAERKQRVVGLMENNRDRPELYYELSRTLMDGGDGREYEDAVKKCIQFYPRDPTMYWELSNWYLMQSRVDLAEAILKEGRELMGTEEFPVQPYEEDYVEPEEEKDGDQSESDGAGVESDNKADSKHDSNEAAKREDKPKTKFDDLMEKIGDKLDKQKKLSFKEALTYAEVIELRKMNRDGIMSWLNSVRFFSNLINLLLDDRSLQPDEQAEELKKLLPDDSIPGIPDRFAGALFDTIRGEIQRPVAEQLVRWVDKHCKRIEQYASLRFNRAFYLERMGRHNDSEKELNEIVKKNPGYAPVFFRLGQIYTDRREYQNAMKYHEQCLQITPGNPGALDELVLLSRHLQTDDYVHWLKARERLHPHSIRMIHETALGILDTQNDMDKALEWVNHSDHIPESDRKLLMARMNADQQNHAQAMQILNQVDVQKRQKSYAEWIEIDCLVADGKFAELRPRLEKMLEETPDNYDVVDQLARVYRELDPQKAQEFSQEKLSEGIAIPVLAYVCVQGLTNWLDTVREIVEKVKEENQPAVVSSFNEVLNHPDFGADYVSFLKWASKKFPQMVDLRASLATRLNLQYKDKEAIKVAKKLLAEDPDNPRWLNLMGICIQDIDPNASIGYLRKEYELTGSSDALCRMARGYQILNEGEKAQEYYWQTLEANPNDTLAITNLVYSYETYTTKIFDLICNAIKLGYGVDDQYFHVVAVKVALKLKRKVPPEWFGGALDRFHVLLNEGSFADEAPLLRKSILAFAVKHKVTDCAKQFGSFFGRLFARFTWPGFSWIPD